MGVAIVTGASSGMGREFARALSARDDVDEVWIVARRAERLEALTGELATPTCVICADLSTDEGLAAVRSELEENKPLVSYLVNAAGLGKVGSYATISDADVASMVDVNCRAAVLLTQMTIPYMTRGSHILEVVSCASFLPLPHLNVYAASKAFMQSYTRGLRWELFGTGICATAVCPFWVKTEFVAVAQRTRGASDIRHYPLAQRPQTVVRRGLLANRLHLAVACCGVPSFLLRVAGKFIPWCVDIAGWEVLRRV
jgi:short-subunit dehydrogenase